MIDLCTGPHIPSTNLCKAFQVNKNSSSYWLADSKKDSLQRIYGISFLTPKELKEYNKALEEATKRDHREIGKQKDLFFFNEISPGSCFYFPDGARLYNNLIQLMRKELMNRNYSEVLCPNMFNLKLWKTSGHYKNYLENLFMLKVEKQGFGFKPMNCPGHCVVFNEKLRSYRDLPIRMSEFGVLHRNELSGTLNGLFRVRRFVQDDAHIFARFDQIEAEINDLIDLCKYIYSDCFGMAFEIKLSTRPEKYIGDIENWNKAESILLDLIKKSGYSFKINPGDGAFYGPKIDIDIKDALGRPHQL